MEPSLIKTLQSLRNTTSQQTLFYKLWLWLYEVTTGTIDLWLTIKENIKNCNLKEALYFLCTWALTKLRPGWRGVKLVVKVNRQLGQKLERNEKFMGLNGLNWVIDYKPCVLKLLLSKNEGIPCEILLNKENQ